MTDPAAPVPPEHPPAVRPGELIGLAPLAWGLLRAVWRWALPGIILVAVGAVVGEILRRRIVAEGIAAADRLRAARAENADLDEVTGI